MASNVTTSSCDHSSEFIMNCTVSTGTTIMCHHSSDLNINCSGFTNLMDSRYLSKLSPVEDYLMAFVLALTGMVGGGLNILVLVVSFKFRKLVRPLEIYMVHVAVNDLLMVLTMYPFSIPSSIMHRWIAGDTGCEIYGFLGSVIGMSSIYTLSVMSFARYLKICIPRYSSGSRMWVLGSLAGAELGGLFWALAPLLGWGHYGPEPHGTSCTVAWGDHMNASFSICLFIFGLCIPVTVMIFSYLQITRFIKKEGTNATSWADVRMIKMSFLMCGGFLLAWGPYAGVSVTELIVAGSVPPRASAFPALFAKSAGIYNPLIYFLSSNKFRDQSRDLLQGIRKVVFAKERGTVHPVNTASDHRSQNKEGHATSQQYGLITGTTAAQQAEHMEAESFTSNSQNTSSDLENSAQRRPSLNIRRNSTCNDPKICALVPRDPVVC